MKKILLVGIIFTIFAGSVLVYRQVQIQKLRSTLSTSQNSTQPTTKENQQAPVPPEGIENWQTYIDSDLTFQYPPDWTVSGNILSINSPKIQIEIIPKDSTLMNECMVETTTQANDTGTVKKFTRATTGEMCQTSDETPREIWIMPTTENYSPGIKYSYSSNEAMIAEAIFDQILTTFKFLPED